MKLYKLIKLFFLLTILLIYTSCSKKENKMPEVIRPVHVSNAIALTVPIYVQSFGYLTAKNSVNIKSQVTGKILNCYFDQGQDVKKGDLLFTIDPHTYQTQLNQAEAALEQDEADLKMKSMIVNRDEKLVEHGAIANQDYSQYITDLNKVKAKIEFDKAEIVDNKIMLSYCQIRSPINGVTGVRLVDPGNIVTANSGPTLVNVKTVDPLYLDFTIPEKNLLRLKTAMEKNKLKVLVFVDEFGLKKSIEGKNYTGTLEFFDNSIDHETGTIFLRAVIPNKERELWPGQFVRLFLILDNIKDATLVPYQSVSRGLNGNYIFTISQDNKAVLHYIKPGQKEESYIIINSKDIKPGDKIVTVGQMGLAPNVKVKIIGTDKFPKPNFTKIQNSKFSKVKKMGKRIQKKNVINKEIQNNKKIPGNQKEDNQ